MRETNADIKEAAMAMTLEQLKLEAMKLTPDERADFADWLFSSVATRAEVDAAWEVEIARRWAEIEAGTAKLIPAEEVFAKIDTMLGKAKS